MVELEKPKLLKVTHALAKRFKDMERFPRDRDLQPARLEWLKKIVNSGEYRGSEWVSCHVAETDKTYRLNGNHTATVLCEAFDAGKEVNAVQLVREYACDTMEEAARLWSTFDPAGSARRKPDIIRSFAGVCPDLDQIHSKTLSLIAAGLMFAVKEMEWRRIPAEDQALFLIQHTDFAVWVSGIVEDRSSLSHLRRIPVVAAMYKTWMKSRQAATEFWTMIRDDCDLPVKSGPRALHKWLITHGLGAYGKTRRRNSGDPLEVQRQFSGYREMYVRCLHGWNAWRKNETTTLQYFPNAKTPAAA